MIEVDIELALLDCPENMYDELTSLLPESYTLEDKYQAGWGMVIRCAEDMPANVDDAIKLFLKGLDELVNVVRNYDSLLRVGVFYDTITLTYQLKSIRLLDKFSVGIEVSSYPST